MIPRPGVPSPIVDPSAGVAAPRDGEARERTLMQVGNPVQGVEQGGIDLIAPRIAFEEAVSTERPEMLDECQFVVERAYEAALRATYFDAWGSRRAESSRTTPQRPIDLPIGVWMLDDFVGLHGREISQLRLLEPSVLLVSEDTGAGKRGDVARYAEWLRQGLVPPPITVVETWEGNLKISNGHRRALAATEAGVLVPAWVGPTVTLPSGSRVGLTLELARSGFKAANP